MTDTVICSFWVDRRREFPTVRTPYLEMLKILDRSARAAGFDHVVLTDSRSAPQVEAKRLKPWFVDLPRPLMQATTEVQARWLASPYSAGVNTVFVGADCLVLRDFRADLPAADLAIAFMKDHKKWRLNNGFMHVPAESRAGVAKLFRLIADDTGPELCDDMLAIERSLVPMPPDFGTYSRRGLEVAFLPLPTWNRYMAPKQKSLDDAAHGANVLHFMGGWENGKRLFFDWARKHRPELTID